MIVNNVSTEGKKIEALCVAQSEDICEIQCTDISEYIESEEDTTTSQILGSSKYKDLLNNEESIVNDMIVNNVGTEGKKMAIYVAQSEDICEIQCIDISEGMDSEEDWIKKFIK
ncbi:unnamed protein product [Gordionus sp. m RMFG-2023]|uniref:uncharacterized protein LOC135927901 n=1 Tax=Gordionus sp. m RMFG-2023 TaxID=3053472 RepID=UPI0030DF483C